MANPNTRVCIIMIHVVSIIVMPYSSKTIGLTEARLLTHPKPYGPKKNYCMF